MGVDLKAEARKKGMSVSEAFNRLVISKTGIVGVHFKGCPINGQEDPLIRYAVCADVLNPAFQSRFEDQLSRLKPEY